MVQQAATGIARAGKRKWGYDPAQVDAFLSKAHKLYDGEGAQLTQADIQNVSFDAVKDGYVIAQVDAALARLERAVVDKQTAWEIGQKGRVAWRAATEELYRSIERHLERKPRERFDGGKPKHPSYDRKQVDRLVDRVADKAALDLGLPQPQGLDAKTLEGVTATAVSNSVFTQRKGAKGYDEREVDYFLNACAQLLSRIESYERVGDALAEDEAARADAAPAPAALPGGVAPLFSPDTQRQAPAAPPQPADDEAPRAFAPTTRESFDALHEAEQHLFTAPAAPAAAPTIPSFAPAASASTVASSHTPRTAASSPTHAAAEPHTASPARTVSSPTHTPVPAVAPSFAPTTQATRPAYHPVPPVPSTAPSAAPAPTTPAAPQEPPAPAMPAPSSMPTAAVPVIQPAVSEPQPVFVPKIPDLEQPSLNTSEFSFRPSLSFDADIPDLSFPTFDDELPRTTDDGKKASE